MIEEVFFSSHTCWGWFGFIPRQLLSLFQCHIDSGLYYHKATTCKTFQGTGVLGLVVVHRESCLSSGSARFCAVRGTWSRGAGLVRRAGARDFNPFVVFHRSPHISSTACGFFPVPRSALRDVERQREAGALRVIRAGCAAI